MGQPHKTVPTGLLLKDSQPMAPPFTRLDIMQIIVVAGIFTVITGALLWGTDLVLARVLTDYQYSGRYGVGLIFFFFAAIGFTVFGRWRGWTNWRFFVFGGLSIFFPLVFLASSLTIMVAPENVLIETNRALLCAGGDRAPLCGEALAAIVFGMSLRAFPAVLILPPVYWYFSVYRPLKSGRR